MDCVNWGEVALYAGGAAVVGLLIGVSVYALAVLPDWALDSASLTHNISIGNYAAARWDAVSLLLPGVTGLGALSHADEAYDTLHWSDELFNPTMGHAGYYTGEYQVIDRFSGANLSPLLSEKQTQQLSNLARNNNCYITICGKLSANSDEILNRLIGTEYGRGSAVGPFSELGPDLRPLAWRNTPWSRSIENDIDIWTPYGTNYSAELEAGIKKIILGDSNSSVPLENWNIYESWKYNRPWGSITFGPSGSTERNFLGPIQRPYDWSPWK